MALLHVDFFSDVLGMCTQMDVILPERGKGMIGVKSAARRDKYPTLYLLHGMSDDHTIWQRRTSIERYASEYNLAVVMPTTHLGWYTDMAHGQKWFTYVTRELPEICRDFFPNMSDRREDTFVAGLSMGGYGALKCGLRAPDVFCCAAPLSGAVDVLAVCRKNADRPDGLFRDIFGEPDQVEGSFNDLFAAASELPAEQRPRIYQWCGKQDFLYEDNLKMRDHLNALGYDLTYSEGDGDHQWRYWDEQIQKVLAWLPLQK